MDHITQDIAEHRTSEELPITDTLLPRKPQEELPIDALRAPEPAQEKQADDSGIEREIRFAAVIYGGVSLTIYINGIAQEMLHLVRSTAEDAGQLSPVEQVYRRLATVVGEPSLPNVQPKAPKPLGDRPGKAGLVAPSRRNSTIRSRFVVDILSGTSAGGINAIFLAKALANNLSLQSLAELWITQADLKLLLNDKSVSPGYLAQNPKPSLLNAPWMYLQLLSALNKMNRPAGAPAPKPLVDDLDLFCTTTDLRGLPVEIPLTDKSVQEERYRNFYHFKRRPGDPNRPLHDFTSDMDPFLAFAARCTSSFPVAFEPMQLGDIINVVKRSNFRQYISTDDPDDKALALFGAEVAQLTGAKKFRQLCRIYEGAMNSQIKFAERPFGDGGYLDNKPFTYAIETMKTRHAELPVDRKLIYIEPSPQDIDSQNLKRPGTLTRPNVIQNSLEALVVLPRYETIRQDLEDVVRWNADISRLHRVIDFTNDAIRTQQITPANARSTLSDATYRRLRLSGTSDQLGDRLAAAASVAPFSAQGQALRAIAGVWRETYYPPVRRNPADGDEDTFLGFFDLEYCERAIRFLRLQLQQLKDPKLKKSSLDELARIAALYLCRNDAPLEVDINVACRSGNAFDCWEQYLDFIIDPQAAARAMGVTFPYEDGMSTKSAKVVAGYPPVTSPSFYSASDAGRDARVRWLFGNPAFIGLIASDDKNPYPRPSVTFEEIVNAIGAIIRDFYTAPMRPAQDREPKVTQFSGEPAGLYLMRAMQSLFGALVYLDPPIENGLERFNLQDRQIYPITFGTNLGEFETVDIFRISPVDTRPIDGTAPPGSEGSPTLRGESLGAFGAFLDQEWRLSDMLRGRLDGAERLITAILPDSDAETMREREHYIQEAQEAIAKEWQGFKDGLNLGMSVEKKNFIRDLIYNLQLPD